MKDACCLNLVVQGKPLLYNGAADVRSLLESRGENTMYVNVRINDEVLGHRDFESITLQDGDSIDFLYYMGGGTCLILQTKKSSGIRGI
ncbi:MAG: sulfur carrier protein ThiS [Actinobacteria bacterium]|nr:sulfur carrier protein ThiS [Actinomycetota bacterium]